MFKQVCDRYGFPEKVQHWIIGRRLPKDKDTLQDLGIVQSGTTLFLYLLSGHRVGLRRSEFERIQERTSAATGSADSSANPRNSRTTDTVTSVQGNQTAEASNTDLDERTAVAQARFAESGRSNANNVEQEHQGQVRPIAGAQPAGTLTHSPSIRELQQMIMNHEDIVQAGTSDQSSSLPTVVSEDVMSAPTARAETQLRSMPSDNINSTTRVQGWQCRVCTFINTPTRPGCEICSSSRPEDYIVPNQIVLDERERSRIAEERRQIELFRQVLSLLDHKNVT